MAKKVPPFEEVDFEIERELWNMYELEEGRHRVTLRMRSILTKLWKPRFVEPEPLPLVGIPKSMSGAPSKSRRDEFQMSFQNIVVVASCPPELMGSPSLPIPPNELAQLPSEEINFTAFNEEWNIYKIADSGLKLKIKLVVSSVMKPKNMFDQFGYPMYVVQSTNAIVPVPPKTRK
jgi:hypothetical protein